MDQGEGNRDQDGGEQTQPDGLGDRRDRAGGKGGAEHLSFKADIEDAGTLGEEPGKGCEDQRNGDADGGLEEHHDNVEEIHGFKLPWSGQRPRRAGWMWRTAG
ncbi:hypothetical protein D9M72_550160 [compost metagenome]